MQYVKMEFFKKKEKPKKKLWIGLFLIFIVIGGVMLFNNKFDFIIEDFTLFGLGEIISPAGWQEEYSGNYTIDGDSVYINDSKIYLIASPHTISSSDWVYFNLTSKVYSGDADIVVGFDTDYIKPKKLELYKPHTYYWNTSYLRIVNNVTSFQTTSADCDVGYEYNNIKRNVTYLYSDKSEEIITTSQVFCFDNYTDLGNNDYQIEWLGEFSEYRLYKDKTGLPESIEHDYQDMTKWWYIKNLPIQQDETYDVRIKIAVSSFGGESGKYWIAIKPSGETISEAIASGHLYALDPWYIGTDGYLDFVTPTPPNNTATLNQSQEINVSIFNVSLDSFKWNWNGTNYSIMNDSLVLFMNMDNLSSLGENDTHVVDLSGYGNNGTGYNGVVVNTTNCKYGNCFTFDAVNDHINITDDASLTLIQDFTISVWVKLADNSGSAYQYIISNGGYSANPSLNWWFAESGSGDANHLWFNVGDGDTTDIEGSSSGTYGTSRVWQHLVLVRSGDTITQYINTIADGTNTNVNMDSIDGGAWYFGGKSDLNADRFFNGSIDEVRIYNRSLSADEIQILYMSNLNKYDTDKWAFYINQTLNSTDLLPNGTYTYFASATDNSANSNQTEERTLIIGESPNNAPTTPDLNRPLNNTRLLDHPTLSIPLNWSNSTDADGDSINYSLQVWNDTTQTDIMYTNYTIVETTNTTGDIVSFPNVTGDYFWRVLATDGTANSSWSGLFNVSIAQTGVADTCSPSSPLSANYVFQCSDNCDITSNIDAGGYNVTLNGTGSFRFSANITNYDWFYSLGGCNWICDEGCWFDI